MLASVIVAGLTCIALTLTVYFLPQRKIGNTAFSLYSIVPLVGAIVAVIVGCVTPSDVFSYFASDSSANPVKIIILFISMSLISVYLDETGFFEYVAYLAVKKTGGVQIRIFIVFYIVVSILTVFTSNDIVILTFTPFICQFCKHSKINPVPYVFAQFVAANTFSMLLVIGNPTNVFLSQSSGITFLRYLSVMWLPTLLAGTVAFFILILVFRKSLYEPMQQAEEEATLKEKTFTVIGLVYLLLCTISIAVLPYFGIEMYYIAAIFCVLLFLTVAVLRLIKRQRPTVILKTVKRAPFEMIPLVLGMSVIALALFKNGVTPKIAEILGDSAVITKYGVLSTLSSNLLNNIPMSIIFADITSGLNGAIMQKAVYSTVIGSNIGAYLTPLGALAGLMFTSILTRHEVKFAFGDFVKYGFIVAPLTLAAALLGLYIMLL